MKKIILYNNLKCGKYLHAIFFRPDKAHKKTNNCIQSHKVLKKTNNCIQPRNICMPIVIRIHTLTTENNINLLVESDKGTPQTIVVSSDQVII